MLTYPTPHLDKVNAALNNPKFQQDRALIEKILQAYNEWVRKTNSLTSKGRTRVEEMVSLLNSYKDLLEIELIMKQASPSFRRQKGQLKLDNSVLEEFFTWLVRPEILDGLSNVEKLVIGPQNAFMSLAFVPRTFADITGKPSVEVKTKDQDFVIGSRIFYRFAPEASFRPEKSSEGSLVLAVLATEFKVNLDKTMFQEAAGTATRLKQGCPASKYFLVIEYLDMTPEDPRLTAIDNVILLRHAYRLPFEKRNVVTEVENQHRQHPIDWEMVWKFVQEVQSFIAATWYNPEGAVERGTFI